MPHAIATLADVTVKVTAAQVLNPATHPRAYRGEIAGALARLKDAETLILEAARLAQ